MQEEHGLREEAKLTLIEVVFDSRNPSERALALYLLGAIALEEGDLVIAKKRWEEVRKDYPESAEAKKVAQQEEAIALLAGVSQYRSAANPLANLYLRFGDQWSRGRATILDPEFDDLPKVEAAAEWYDLVVREFPNTDAARIAMESKMLTLLGWQDESDSSRRHGLAYDYEKYMPRLIVAFEEYVGTFPEASARHAFRFLIGQAFYNALEFEQAKIWFQGVMESDPSQRSLFGHLARLRLLQLK